VFRSELPNPTQKDFEELNASLLGGDMVEPSSSFPRGGGTPLPRAFDTWDDVRKALPNIGATDSELEAAERILGGEIDESACLSRRWDTDWWRLRLARSAWISTSDLDEESASSSQANACDEAEQEYAEVVDEEERDVSMDDLESDMQRNPTMLTGYPQKGALYTPGALNGLWTGRMVIPSETHLRALLLPPQPPAHLPHNADDPAAVALGPEGGPNANAIPDPNNDPNIPLAEPQEPQEPGHRPQTFTEDTLRLVAVPLYVRLAEYAVFSGGKSVPCANDTMDVDADGDEGNASGSGSGPGSGFSSGSRDGNANEEEASYDQGIRDAWFPPNTTLSTEGDRVVVTVPPGADNLHTRSESKEFTYVKVEKKDFGEDAEDAPVVSRGMGSEAEARSRRQPGTFHDRDTCPGCLAREQALLAARIAAEAEDAEANPNSDCEDTDSESIDLPPYVPSPQTLPLCNGVRDVLLTGSTDPRHAAAWGKWGWRGRVRSWDGLVGLVRSVDNGSGTGIGTGGNSKIFFYGTLLGERNLVGTWRLAHEDPRMPAYEGAFTLGRKDE